MQKCREQSEKYWEERHVSYERENIKVDDWLERFSSIIEPCMSPILDLGCGGGNNTLYLVERGKRVIPCDQSSNAIRNIYRNFPEVSNARCFNFLDGFDFLDQEFDIICADLCLHYFTYEDTKYILQEIYRIMKDGGHMFVRVNSVKDVLHGAGQGKEIEHHVYLQEDGTIKRFFDLEDISTIFSEFEILFCEEEPMNRYRTPKIAYTICLKK